MKSINKRFEKIIKKNPDWSTYTCFVEAINGQKFCKKNIYYWFLKLVEKNDYDLNSKKEIMTLLCELSKESVEGIKRD